MALLGFGILVALLQVFLDGSECKDPDMCGLCPDRIAGSAPAVEMGNNEIFIWYSGDRASFGCRRRVLNRSRSPARLEISRSVGSDRPV
jgi:hypothetical protein